MTDFAFDIPRAIEMTTQALLRELGDEVDLIVRFGSLLRGGTNRFSDLDIVYVPQHPTTWNSITVLVNDIMVDLFAMHWSRLEEMARFQNGFNTILADSKIIYARHDGLRRRFQELQEELLRNQQPAARPAMLRQAEELFQRTAYGYYLLHQEAARGHRLAALKQAQNVLTAVLHILGVVNQTPVDSRKLPQVLALPKQPENLGALVSRIMGTTDPDELLEATGELMANTRALLITEQQTICEKRPLAETLDAGYPELKGEIQHLILACERRDPYNFNLVSLLHELQIHMAWALEGIPYSDFNSLAEYDQDLAALGFPELLPYLQTRDYDGLARQCRRFDQRLREYLNENGVPLNEFASLDELQVYLDGRTAGTL